MRHVLATLPLTTTTTTTTTTSLGTSVGECNDNIAVNSKMTTWGHASVDVEYIENSKVRRRDRRGDRRDELESDGRGELSGMGVAI